MWVLVASMAAQVSPRESLDLSSGDGQLRIHHHPFYLVEKQRRKKRKVCESSLNFTLNPVSSSILILQQSSATPQLGS